MSFIESNTALKTVNEVACKCGRIEIRGMRRKNATCQTCKKKRIKEANQRNRLKKNATKSKTSK